MTMSLFDEIGILICILIAIVSNDGLEISLRLVSRSPSDMARLFPWTGRVDGPRLEFGRKSFLLEGAVEWNAQRDEVRKAESLTELKSFSFDSQC